MPARPARRIRPPATGVLQAVRAAGTLLMCLPAATRHGVLVRMAPSLRRMVVAMGCLAPDEAVAVLAVGFDRRHAHDRMSAYSLACDPRLNADQLRVLAALTTDASAVPVLVHPATSPELRAEVSAAIEMHPVELVRTVSAHSAGAVRLLLGAADLELVRYALFEVELAEPLHDAAFLGAALRLWDAWGTERLRAELDDHLVVVGASGRRVPRKGVRSLRAHLDHPQGRAHLARLHKDAPRGDGLAARLRRASTAYPASEVLAGTEVVDWTALARAHRERPLPSRARCALLARHDFPRELVAEFLLGLGPGDELMGALYAGTTTAAEIVRCATPARWLLDYIDRTVEAVGAEGQAVSSLPFLYALSDLLDGRGSPHPPLGDDPDTWLRLLLLAHDASGTIPELLGAARDPDSRPAPAPRWYRRNPRRGLHSLLLTLAPAGIASELAESLKSHGHVAERRFTPRDFGPIATAWRSWNAPLTRASCLTLLRDTPLDLAEESRPGARWIWPALGHRLIHAEDLLTHAHPASAALEVLSACRETAPEVFDDGTEALKALAGAIPAGDAVGVWHTAVVLLVDGFTGTVAELVGGARAVTA